MDKDIVCLSGIYAITNTVNGKKYIGSSVGIVKRWDYHRMQLCKGVHHSATLQRSWVKYGKEAFKFTVLESVPNTKVLLQREQFWIDSEQCIGRLGYNMSPTAGSPLGVKHTESARKNMSAAHKGKVLTEEHKRKIGLKSAGRNRTSESIAKAKKTIADRGWFRTPEGVERARLAATGRVVSAESRDKIRIGGLGHVVKESTKEKLRAINTGKKMSADAIARTSAAHRGVSKSQEQKDKISKTLTGRKPSPDEIAKMVAIKRTPEARENARLKQTGKKQSPESIAKMVATQKANRLAKLAA